MDHDENWNAVVTRLRRAGLDVVQFDVGQNVTDDELEVIKLMDKTLPPPPITQFLKTSNGVKLRWQGTLDDISVQGSINIISLLESSMRAPAQEEGEPLEDVLWNDEFEPRVRDKLKRMSIFEAIAGRSAYLTYFVDTADAKLYLVDNDSISPIIPDFETTVELLRRYAGAHGLREHLTHRDWRKRLNVDKALQRIAAL